MKFNNQSQFNGHQITNVVDRPILHKKGKRWITIGLSTLLLAGLGTLATTNNIHADTINNNTPTQNNSNQGSKQKLTPSNVVSQASILHNKIAQANSLYQTPATSNAKKSQVSNSTNTTSKSNAISSTSTSNSTTNLSYSNQANSSNTTNTLEFGTKLQQAKRWNYLQNGIQGHDFDNYKEPLKQNQNKLSKSTTPIITSQNNSRISKVNMSQGTNTSSNDSSNLQSVSSFTNSLSTAPINSHRLFNPAMQSYEIQMSSIDNEIASMNAVDVNNNAYLHKNTGLLKDDNTNVPTNVIFYTNRDNMNVRVGSDMVTNNDTSVQDALNNATTSDKTHINNDYKLDSSNPQKLTLNGQDSKIEVDNTQPMEQSDDIPVIGNNVTFTGNIVLNFPEKGHIHPITIPYSISTQVDSTLQNILNEGIENGNPSVLIPNDYVNKTIQQFNTSNFSYTNTNSSPSDTYKGVYIQPSDGSTGDTKVTNNGNGNYTYNNSTITFNFTANKVPETIHFQYKGSNITNNPKDANGNSETNDSSTITISGNNDEQGSLASNDAPAGWHIATGTNGESQGNNSWIYGNEDNDNPQGQHDINIEPNSASATIYYQVSDASATNNGSQIASSTFTGNDYRAVNAGNNTYDITSATAMNTNTTGNNSNGLPAGYHVVVSDGNDHTVPLSNNTNIKVPYDNNASTHVIKIQGNMHNPNHIDTNPSTAPSTNGSDVKIPTNIPTSDVKDTVAVVIKEFSNSQNVRTYTKYIVEQGRTGETYSIAPNDYLPNGYQLTPSDTQNVNNGTYTGLLTANGVSRPKVTFDYDARTGTGISVVFEAQNQGDRTIETGTIAGEVDTVGNILQYPDLNMPAGYHLVSATNNGKSIENATNTNIPYHVTTGAQNDTIIVAGNSITPHQSIKPSNPNTPSDTPTNPTKPSDVPTAPINPNNHTTIPSDNPVVPSHKNSNGQIVPNQTSDIKPNGKNGTANQPYSNPSDLTPSNPQDANDTFYVIINDFGYNPTTKQFDKLERQYVKRIVQNGTVGDSFTISPDIYTTNGYTKDNSDNNYTGFFGADGLYQAVKDASSNNLIPGTKKQNSIVWNYKANKQNGTIKYKDQAGNIVSDTVQGHTDSNINVTKPSDGGVKIPAGYHLIPNTNYNYQFNSPMDPTQNNTQIYNIEGNSVNGTATISVNYNELYSENGNIYKTDSSNHIPYNIINAHIGDQIVIDPTNYEKDNYNDTNTPWTIPMTWSDVSKFKGITKDNSNNISNYKPSIIFNYNGLRGVAQITYVDISHPLTNSDKFNTNYTANGTRQYNGQTYPVISTTKINNLGTLGSIVNLTAKGSKVGDAVLVAPSGYHFANSDNNDRPLLQVKNIGGMMKFTLFLRSNKPNIKPMPKPNTPKSSASNNKPSNSASTKPDSTSISIPTFIPAIKAPIVPNDVKQLVKDDLSNHTNHTNINNNNNDSNMRFDKISMNYIKPKKATHYYVYSPTNIILHGKYKNLFISKQRGFTGKIIKTTKINHKKVFVIKWHHKTFIVNAQKTKNAYVQPKEFEHHAHGLIKHAIIKLRKDANIYDSINYNNKTVLAHIKAGSTFTVIGLKKFGQKGYERNRFVLSDGLIITANKNYVKFLK